MSVFEGLTGPALLATGRTVNIIDATPENFDQVREFYETLGAKSSHFRFLACARPSPSPSFARWCRTRSRNT